MRCVYYSGASAGVAHRQFVFTIPKRLRIYFRYDRSLLGSLCQAAWRTVSTVYQAVSERPDGVPGMIGAIQTFGDATWSIGIRIFTLWFPKACSCLMAPFSRCPSWRASRSSS